MSRKPSSLTQYDPRMAPAAAPQALRWHLPSRPPFVLSGLAWFQHDRAYRRLPRRTPEPLPDAVNALANCPAGAQARFQTDSCRIAVRVRLAGPADMVHMPATGQCGFDLYTGQPGRLRFLGVTKYDVCRSEYEALLFRQNAPRLRNYVLNFPLYQGVRTMHIGLDPSARVLPPPPFAISRPIVVYGTSITQGGCASRPGMAYTNILSRRLNVEFVNLGFSGSGKGESEVARVIAGLTAPALFLLDYEANCESTARYRGTLPEFTCILRACHPDVPILLVSRIPFATDRFDLAARAGRRQRRAFQRQFVARLRRAGDRHIHFFDGSPLLGRDDDECTVDGVHPTDLGFLRIADGLEPVLRALLKRQRQR